MQEIVYLSNSFCKKDFPNNQAGNFQNKLNKSLTFKTKGKVALSEILYTPGSWDNVRPGSNAIEIEISEYPVFKALYVYKELFVDSAEIIEPGLRGFTDPVYCIYRERNGEHVALNYIGVHLAVVATGPFQRLRVKIKEIKIDNSTNDHIYIIYDSLYRSHTSYNVVYWLYNYHFPEKVLKASTFNRKPVWILNYEIDKGVPVSTIKYLNPQNYEDINTLLEILTVQCNDALEELLKKHALPRILEWPNPTIFEWPISSQTKKKNWLIIFYNDIQPLGDLAATRKAGERRVQLGIASDYPVKVKITLPSSLAYMLGLTEHLNIPGKYWDNNHPYNTTAYNRKILYQIWEAETTSDLKRNTLRSICIFSDIIDSNFVGDMQMPLMRMLLIDSTTNQIPASFFIIQTYYNVNKISVETVKMWTTEYLDGDPINFNDKVYIKLIFEGHV